MSAASDTRAWGIYVCPSCHRYTTDSDQIDCDCDVDAWDDITVVPADRLQAAVDALNEFRDGLTNALDAHGVPAMPSWREAIDWLAANGGQSA